MSTVFLKKTGGSYVETMMSELPDGEYKAVLTRPRSLAFHRKYFALLKTAYDLWDPQVDHLSEKSFECFRNDIAILCGYYKNVIRYSGRFVQEAKSISFAKMDDVEFAALYSKTIDVILQHVLTNYTRADLDEQVDRVLRYV